MASRSLYYDRNGDAIDSMTWAKLHSDITYLRVARTTVTSGADLAKTFDVSTVWLGIDHGFGEGAPVIFETMVFAEGSEDQDCRRYTTEDQAKAGHVEMVTVVAATLDDAIVMDVE